MKNNEDIRYWIFSSFLTICIYSDTEIDQILTVYRNQSVEYINLLKFSVYL